MKSIRLLLFFALLASLGLMPVVAGPRHADTLSVQPPAQSPPPTPAPEQTPPEPEIKEKVKKEKEPEENATELQKEKQEGGKGAPKEAEEKKKEEKWDVNNPPGPSSEVAIDTDEGTWMSLDVSPDGKEIAFDLLGDLYTLPIAGGEARALTHDVAWQMQPRYSPDGKALAFTSDQR